MRTALAVGMTVAVVAFLTLPASAGAPAPRPAPAPAPKAAPAPTPEVGLFSEDGMTSKLTITGEIRNRFEFRRNMTDLESSVPDNHDWVDARVRLGFNFELNDGVGAFIQPQGQFVWGNPQSILVDNVLSLYQAYVTLKPEIARNETAVVKIGRQELGCGSQIFMGNNDRNGGLSFDSLRLDMKLVSANDLDWQASFFAAKGVENDAAVNPADGRVTDIGLTQRADVNGIGMFNHINLPNNDTVIEIYGCAFMIDRGVMDPTVTFPFPFSGDIVTIGARVLAKKLEFGEHSLDLSVEAATQVGRIDDGPIGANNKLDLHDVYAFEAELGYTLPVTGKPRIAIGVASASGEDHDDTLGPRTSDNTFRPIFGSNEKAPGVTRLGEADLFSLSNLNAFFLKFAFNPVEKVKLGAEYMRVWTNKDATVVGGNNLTVNTGFVPASDDHALVDEFDLFADYRVNKNVALRATWAIVVPANNVSLDNGGTPTTPSDDNTHRFFVTLDVKW